MTDKEASDIESAIIVGALFITVALAFLALTIAIVGQKDIRVLNDSLDGQDMSMAVSRCIPYNATFEQELACFDAVYGKVK